MLKRLLFMLFVLIAIQLIPAVLVHSAQLTSDQARLLEGLSSDQQAVIAAAAGKASKPADRSLTTPPVVAPREVGETSLEQSVRQPTADKLEAEVAASASASTNVPLIKLSGQAEAEQLELRRAFADFVRESKPLSVSTDLRQFGYELFAGVPTTFAPATDVPVPSEYVLGPGDELKVQLFGKLDRELLMVVDREGTVNFPEIGPLAVAGMGFAEARAYIAGQVKNKMIGVSLSITMGKLRSIRIFALGDVERPGSYTVSGLSTLSHALFVSGGVKKIGSLRSIQLKRQGKLIATLDLYDFLLQGDTSSDVRLLPGDVVFVPPIGKTVAVAGEVVRPAIYELRWERVLADALKLAGGLRPTAYHDHALIERLGSDGERNILQITLEAADLKTPLSNGDTVKVFSVLDIEKNPVLLLGNVKRPGKYAWSEGMRLSRILPSSDVLLPETYMDYGLIQREAEGNREPELIRFSLSSMWAQPDGDADLLLKARDQVYVFHQAHFRQKPMLTIAGSVQTPGKYELKKSMHLVDLILAAGGLMRDAYREEAELYRTDPLSKEVRKSSYSPGRALAGNEGENPILQDMDRVVVHSIWESKRRHTITVVGEVHHPGQFELTEGMHISDLIFAAGNVTEKAYLKQAEITRYDVVDGERRVSKHMQLDLEDALANDGDGNMLLMPYDVLAVRQLSNWRSVEQVKLEGEITYPGSYPVEEGEKLSSVLRRAGGYTNKAYLPAAV
ncbi:MAG: SLBB domain-containing protein, partial [Mariprofundaceae bacterium]